MFDKAKTPPHQENGAQQSADCSRPNSSTSRLEAAAVAYAERLGLAVFPLQRGAKIPYKRPDLGLEHGCLDASTDPVQVREWWRALLGSNIGIAGGSKSGVWFLDIDPRHGGAAALEALISIHGELPETPRQATGGADNGEHIVFAWPTDARVITNSSGSLPAGLDVRGEGGYIVGAPSIHPDTDREYMWLDDAHPLKIKPVPAPEWLLDMVAQRPSTGPVCARTPDEWRGIIAPKNAGEGRHEALLSLFGLLVRKLPAGVALALARSWNQTNLIPPLEDSEVDRVVGYVLRKEVV